MVDADGDRAVDQAIGGVTSLAVLLDTRIRELRRKLGQLERQRERLRAATRRVFEGEIE